MPTNDLTYSDYVTALENGISPVFVPEEIQKEIWENDKDVVFSSIAQGYFWRIKNKEPMKKAPKHAIVSYFENGGTSFLPEDIPQFSHYIDKQDLYKLLESDKISSPTKKNLLHSLGLTLNDLPRNVIKATLTSGIVPSFESPALTFGTKSIISDVFQMDLNEGVAKGGNILQELISIAYPSKGKEDSSEYSLRKMLEKLPQEVIESYYAHGGRTTHNISAPNNLKAENQSEEIKNQYIVNDGFLQDDGRHLTARQCVERLSNGGSSIVSKYYLELPSYLRCNIITRVDKNKKLLLLAANKGNLSTYDIEHLPQEIFANSETRKALLKIIERRSSFSEYEKLKSIVEKKQQFAVDQILSNIKEETKIERFADTEEGKKSLQEEREQREQNQKKAAEAARTTQNKEKAENPDEQRV